MPAVENKMIEKIKVIIIFLFAKLDQFTKYFRKSCLKNDVIITQKRAAFIITYIIKQKLNDFIDIIEKQQKAKSIKPVCVIAEKAINLFIFF